MYHALSRAWRDDTHPVRFQHSGAIERLAILLEAVLSAQPENAEIEH